MGRKVRSLNHLQKSVAFRAMELKKARVEYNNAKEELARLKREEKEKK